MSVRLLPFACLLLGLTAYGLKYDPQQFKNTKVERLVDLTGQFCEITNTVHVLNTGRDAASKYYYTVPLTNHDKLAHIFATVDGDNINLLNIDFVEQGEEYALYKIKMPRGVKPEAKAVLEIHEVLSQKMPPFPKKIGIFDEQYLKYEDCLHMFSPYPTGRSTTRVKFPNKEIEEYTQLPDSKLEDTELSYGTYNDLQPFRNETIAAHFNHNVPLPYFSHVERRIEVSHWGNIAVSEFYELVNRGAELKGEFSRVDFLSKNQASA
jgi:oligosaccharyltransferase complex subunit alpha (ribophorin I)